MFVLTLMVAVLGASAQWTLVNDTESAPSSRSGHSLLPYNNTLVLFGGCNSGSLCYNDVQVYSFQDAAWSRIQTSGTAPRAREGHSANIVANEMFIFGGASMQSLLNDLYALDLDTVRRYSV
jgi:N-acetylneuraminic acid mutarotase